jgi:hypothetical protein
VKDHITRSSMKSYAEQFERFAGVRRPVHPRRVVLLAAGSATRSLEYGFGCGVVPASPTNLIAP